MRSHGTAWKHQTQKFDDTNLVGRLSGRSKPREIVMFDRRRLLRSIRKKSRKSERIAGNTLPPSFHRDEVYCYDSCHENWKIT